VRVDGSRDLWWRGQYSGAVIVTAELAAIYPALAEFLPPKAFAGQVIADLGTEAQKNKYLPGVIDGSALITSV